jgi:hypothetical protein
MTNWNNLSSERKSDSMLFLKWSNARRVIPSHAQRTVRRLHLEQLEDRVVPSITDGTLLVATFPSTFSYQDQSSFPTGIVGVNPGTGAQSLVSTGGLFSIPTYIAEAANQQLYVTDLTAFGTGAVIAVDPNTGQQRLVARDGMINGPNCFVFINGYLYVANEGDGYGSAHNLVRIDPNTGQQTLITDGGGFTVPTGMAPAPGNSVYITDEPGGYEGADLGSIWQVNLDTGQQIQIAHGGLIDHPVDVAVDPNGNLIVINTGSPRNSVTGSVVRINPQTGVQTLVTVFGPYSGTDSGSVSADGSTIFVGAIASGSSLGQIIAVDAVTGAQTPLCAAGSLSEVEGIRVFNSPVQATATITTVVSSANPAAFGQSVTFTAVISAQNQSNGAPTGTVQFQMDGINAGDQVSVTTSGGVTTARFTTTTLATGSHTVTAIYSGDVNFAGSTGILSGGQTVDNGAAGNVTVTLDPSTWLLSITGDAGNDVITITQVSAGVLQVAGVGTTVNQSSSPVTFNFVTGIAISFLNGNDRVTMTNVSVPGTISIAAGTGCDFIALDTILANFISITATGTSKAAITLKNTASGTASISAGDNANISLTSVSSGSVKVRAGGYATVSAYDVSSSSDLSITLGNNAQSVRVKGSDVGSLNIQQTGTTGNPSFDLESDTIGTNLTLTAGGGDDTVVLSHVSVGIQLLVYLGAGTNRVSADHVTARFGVIDGGPGGNNTYVDGGGNSGYGVIHFDSHPG